MILAAFLFDSHRRPPDLEFNDDGSLDESAQITPGQWARFLALSADVSEHPAYFRRPVDIEAPVL